VINEAARWYGAIVAGRLVGVIALEKAGYRLSDDAETVLRSSVTYEKPVSRVR
jgi:hypothetical protein